MSRVVELGCRCGGVHGTVQGVAPRRVNRAICYCEDCQAFLHYIGRPELLDAQGGTDIVMVAPCTVAFDRGDERIVGVRLSQKGLFRWYASCCKTPLGNSPAPSMPFIGMQHELFRGVHGERQRDEVFGKVRGAIFTERAIGGAPEAMQRGKLGMMLNALRLILGWRLFGKAWPHPFFQRDTGAPSHPVTTLSGDEREALRAKCGHQPKAAA